MNIKRIVGDNVRFIREKKGWVQEDLAIRANISRTYIGEIERGEKTLSIGILDKIAKGLGVEVAVLVTEEAYRSYEA